MLRGMTKVVSDLQACPDTMERKMNRYGGVVFSQTVLLALAESGMSREHTYRLVKGHADDAWNVAGGNFRKALENDLEVTDRISAEHLADCFSTELHQAQLDTIYARLAI